MYRYLASKLGADDNMLMGFGNVSQRMEIWIEGDVYYMSNETKAEMDARMLGWNRHCFTWQTGGQVRVN